MRIFRINVGTGAYEEVPPHGAGAAGALVWVDVDLTDVVDPEKREALRSIELSACPDVLFELAARWYSPDEPGFVREDFILWDEDVVAKVNRSGGHRMIRVDRLDVSALPGIEGRPELNPFSVVLLAGPSWLITSRVPPVLDLDELRDAVLADWRSDYRDGGDLGVLVLRELSRSYLPTIYTLRARLQAVEQAFVHGIEDPENVQALDSTGYRGQLLDLKWAVDSLSVRLPWLLRPGEDPREAWLLVGHALEAAESFASRLGTACTEIVELRHSITTAFALAAAADSATQLEQAAETLDVTRQLLEAEDQRATAAAAAEHRARVLQDAVSWIAAVLLGPGLVAGIYSAVPEIFDDCVLLRTLSMGGFMTGAAIGTWWYLRRRARLAANRPP
jgi:hypothetical protein